MVSNPGTLKTFSNNILIEYADIFQNLRLLLHSALALFLKID